MNRSLTLALILLIITLSFAGVDTVLVHHRLAQNDAAIESLDPKDICSEAQVDEICRIYGNTRLLLAVSVTEGYLNEYEEALAALTAAVRTGKADAYVAARAEAIAALAQIKRSASVSFGQIF